MGANIGLIRKRYAAQILPLGILFTLTPVEGASSAGAVPSANQQPAIVLAARKVATIAMLASFAGCARLVGSPPRRSAARPCGARL